VNQLVSEVVKENSLDVEPDDYKIENKTLQRKNSSPFSTGMKYVSNNLQDNRNNSILQQAAFPVSDKGIDSSLMNKGNLFSKYIKKGFLQGLGNNSRPGTTSSGNALIHGLSKLDQGNKNNGKRLLSQQSSPDIKLKVQKKLELLTSVSPNSFLKSNPNYFLKKL